MDKIVMGLKDPAPGMRKLYLVLCPEPYLNDLPDSGDRNQVSQVAGTFVLGAFENKSPADALFKSHVAKMQATRQHHSRSLKAASAQKADNSRLHSNAAPASVQASHETRPLPDGLRTRISARQCAINIHTLAMKLVDECMPTMMVSYFPLNGYPDTVFIPVYDNCAIYDVPVTGLTPEYSREIEKEGNAEIVQVAVS